MKYLIRCLNKTKQVYTFNPDFGKEKNIHRAESVVDEFYTERGVSSRTGTSFVRHVDPIYMLFNQQRLQQLGLDSAKAFIDSLNQATTDSLAELRKQVSDEDLLTTIKSRHLQTASEIQDWAKYMSKNLDSFKTKVAEAVAKQQAEEAEKQQSNNQEGAAT